MTVAAEYPAHSWESSVQEEDASDGMLPLRRWTRTEYYRLGEEGFFEDERVELLEGEIIQHMSPHKSSHSTSVLFAQSAFLEAASLHSLHVRTQMAITLNDLSEPEPDLSLAVGTAADYAEHHPTPPDIRLLVEVSDATLRIDRTRKAIAYARANIPEYWIINLVNRQLEVYRNPAKTPTSYGYKAALTFYEADTVAPLFALDSPIAVADLLPPPLIEQP